VFLNDKKHGQIILSVAGLGLIIKSQAVKENIISPQSYNNFFQPVDQPQAFLQNNKNKTNVYNEKIYLKILVTKEPIPVYPQHLETKLIFQSKNWGIKFDQHGTFILEALRLPPKRRITINPDFSIGKMQVEFSDKLVDGFYPLQDMDMKLFVNWLARFGDIILHASGISIDDKGYAFAGPAGVGKSTLAELLSKKPGLTVLGEDQVVLRYLDGRFWIFGTPWHENPAMCSPMGVPLEKMFFLERDLQPGIVPVKPVEGFTKILQTAFIPFYRQDLLPGILNCLEQLSKQVPFQSLTYQLGTDPSSLIF